MAIGVLAFSLVAVSGGTSGASSAAVSTNPVDIHNGELLYDQHCSSCHGDQGVGSTKAPELINAGAAAVDFYLSTGRMPLNDPVTEALRHPPYFDPNQISDIVAYVNSLPAATGRANQTGPAVPSVLQVCGDQTKGGAGNVGSKQNGDWSFEGAGGQGGHLGGTAGNPVNDCTSLSEGQQLFSLNCAQCHDASGSGGMLSKGNVIPTLHSASATQVAEAVRIGPDPMPTFGPAQLTDHQVSAIANYVEYLRRPADRGGWAIGHFGPVPEGFMGIVIGLFVILLFTRLIGVRE